MPHTAEARLNDMGIVLPRRPKPIGNYLPGVVVGNILYTSALWARGPTRTTTMCCPMSAKSALISASKKVMPRRG